MQNLPCASPGPAPAKRVHVPSPDLPVGPTPGISGSSFLPRRRAALLAAAEELRLKQAATAARRFDAVALHRSTYEDRLAAAKERERRRLDTRDRHIALINARVASRSAVDNVQNVA